MKTDTEIASWLRAKAKALNDVANALAPEAPTCVKPCTVGPFPDNLTGQMLRGYIATSDKYLRLNDLVRAFDTDFWVVQKLVNDPENGIEIGPRGWLKVS